MVSTKAGKHELQAIHDQIRDNVVGKEMLEASAVKVPQVFPKVRIHPK